MVKRVIAIAACLVIFPIQSFAFDQWDRSDKILLISSLIATVIDWRQTNYIAGHPERYGECNPILGRHPSQDKVHLYFAAATASSVLIAYVLPAKYRKIWLSGQLLLSLSCVVNNVGVGIGIRW